MMGISDSKPILKPVVPLECNTINDGMIECRKAGAIVLQNDITLPIIFRQNLDGSFITLDTDRISTTASGSSDGQHIGIKFGDKVLRCKIIMKDPDGCLRILYNPGLPLSETKISALSPVITGPAVWEMLHCVPYICDDRLTTEGIGKFIKRVGRCLTCSKCQEHFASNVRKNAVELLFGPSQLESWLIDLHNECNQVNEKEKWELERVRKYYRSVAKSVWRRALLNYLYFTFSPPERRTDYESMLESLCTISPPQMDITKLMKKFKPADSGNVKKIYDEIESKLDDKTGWTLGDREAMIRASLI